VKFDDWDIIPREQFEWIEEWHAEQDRKYLVGVVVFENLKNNQWWKENVFPSSLLHPIIEDIEVLKLKKKSLELAGIF
jgi:homoserine dehydrogenase